MFCKNCGKGVLEGDLFCENCGAKTIVQNSEPVVYKEERIPTPKRSNSLIIISACGVLLVAIIISAILVLPKFLNISEVFPVLSSKTSTSVSKQADRPTPEQSKSEAVDNKDSNVPKDNTTQESKDTKVAKPEDKVTQTSTEASKGTTETSKEASKDTPSDSEQKANSVVTFPDSNLQAVIRQRIKKPSGDILKSDVEGITTVDAVGKNISDIEGLQYLVNLSDLQIFDNKISSVNQLENLTKLKVLLLCSNNITNVNPLRNLTNLTDLSIGGDHVADISPIANLTNLEYLNLYANKITDISVLRNMKKMKRLYLDSNPIKDYSPVSDIYKNLTEKDFTLP